jgi:alpha-galactosidase
VYGSNDWYWAYGKNNAQSVLADARHIVELSPSGDNRPFAVIDDGWQPGRGTDKAGVGMWDRKRQVPDMPGLTADIRRAARDRESGSVRCKRCRCAQHMALPRDRATLDPTIPESARKSPTTSRAFGNGGSS